MSAVRNAAVSRVRSVLLGVVPLLLDPFFKSLAGVVTCGLSSATILTLIIVPTLYAVFFRVTANEVEGSSETGPPRTLSPEASVS